MDHEAYFKEILPYSRKRLIAWGSISGYVQRFIPLDSIILELGAGYCYFINNIKAKEKHALDICNIITKCANKNVIIHTQSCADLISLPSKYFNVVFVSNLFEHLSRHEFKKTIYGISRILKNSGLLLVIQPNYKYCKRLYFDDPTHKTVFTDSSLCAALTDFNFVIIKKYPKFLPYSASTTFKFSKIMVDLYLRSPIKPFAKQMFIIARLNK